MLILTFIAGVIIGVVIMALFKSGAIADEFDLIKEIERLTNERNAEAFDALDSVESLASQNEALRNARQHIENEHERISIANEYYRTRLTRIVETGSTANPNATVKAMLAIAKGERA